MHDKIIETKDLTKIYKLKGNKQEVYALNKVNIQIEEGEIFGLLGPNGAGKTTLIQIMTSLKQPTSGSAFINGINILKHPKIAKSQVGLMLDSKMLYYRIKGYDNLRFFCKIYKVPDYRRKIDAIIEDFGLEKWKNQYVENYSSGMKMKLALCRTLLLERPILFLDEPTVGLDIKTVNFIINKLKDVEKTLFITSHDMNVMEKLCDKVAFISNGEILKIGTKEDIQKLEISEIKILIEIHENKRELKDDLSTCTFIENIIEFEKGLKFSLKHRTNYKNLLQILSKYEILKVKEIEPSLEDLFLKII